MTFQRFLQYCGIGLYNVIYYVLIPQVDLQVLDKVINGDMSYVNQLLIVLVLFPTSFSIGVFIASKKGKNRLLWGLIGLVAPALACIPLFTKSERKCPYCQNKILVDMKNCGYCGKDL
jgi:hypothetical protein